MQSSWPASLSFHDNFRQIADRVGEITGGRLTATRVGGLGTPFFTFKAVGER
jgi:TRAP-type mannitol/chloroaromatic compound transport system substrate-binding protein